MESFTPCAFSAGEPPLPCTRSLPFGNGGKRGSHDRSPPSNRLLWNSCSQRVPAIHPDLTWHFGPGSKSEHRLTVSAGGTAEVRRRPNAGSVPHLPRM